MTYPFVASYHDLGLRKGPVLGFVVHMAEGGGTVGYLSRENRHGVSVHYVIEYDGEIVQMLRESHMHSSIRIRNEDGSSALRRDDDADGFFGATAARRVLGDWAYVAGTLGPNHATIAVEIEGFAADGPKAVQADALERLVRDVRTRFPDIGVTGHRDHNVKACPGRRIPWDRVGGHGKEGEPMSISIYQLTPVNGRFTIPAGKSVPAYKPTADGWAVERTWPAAPAPSSASYDARLGRMEGSTTPSSLIRVSSGALEGLYVSTASVVETDTPPVDESPYTKADVDAAVAAAVAADRARARVTWS